MNNQTENFTLEGASMSATDRALNTSRNVQTISSDAIINQGELLNGAGQGGTTHNVVSGDTLSAIAQNNGLSVNDLARYNNIANPNMINVGQTINLPGVRTNDLAVALRIYSENIQSLTSTFYGLTGICSAMSATLRDSQGRPTTLARGYDNVVEQCHGLERRMSQNLNLLATFIQDQIDTSVIGNQEGAAEIAAIIADLQSNTSII